MIIRRLTKDDWDAIELILDSRKTFQNYRMSPDLHEKFKQEYVKDRLTNPSVLFYGYFEDDKLLAFSSFTGYEFNLLANASWTLRGSKLPKRHGSRMPIALIEIRDRVLTDFKSPVFWLMQPIKSSWIPEEPNENVLFDQYVKSHVCTVPANSVPSDEFIYRLLMVGFTLPVDQDVFRYLKKRKPPVIPEDAPVRVAVPTLHRPPDPKAPRTIHAHPPLP